MGQEGFKRNASLPYNRKMEFRIGINVGDVVEEGGSNLWRRCQYSSSSRKYG